MSQPKVYTVNGPSSTSASSLPSWITVKPKSQKLSNGQRKRVKTQRQLGQLELVQDFAFPESAIRIKTTEDGNYAIATGCYKPMIKVWDLNELTVKFERVTDAENVDFVVSRTKENIMGEGEWALRYPPARSCRPTGQSSYISNETVRWRSIRNRDYITLCGYPPMAERWPTTRPRQRRISLARARRCSDSTWRKGGI